MGPDGVGWGEDGADDSARRRPITCRPRPRGTGVGPGECVLLIKTKAAFGGVFPTGRWPRGQGEGPLKPKTPRRRARKREGESPAVPGLVPRFSLALNPHGPP